jgi:hypothetical protein
VLLFRPIACHSNFLKIGWLNCVRVSRKRPHGLPWPVWAGPSGQGAAHQMPNTSGIVLTSLSRTLGMVGLRGSL